MLLADLGARVIKVEARDGDDSRSWGPPFVVRGSDGQIVVTDPTADPSAESTYFLSCNRNKESVIADLKSDDGHTLLEALIARADVLVENFRPGVLERLGFGVDELRSKYPRLVILSISGFGVGGPDGTRAGYDQIMQGEAGLMSITGSPESGPTKVGVPIADLLAGIHGAYGVLAALYERQVSGIGTVVRTSLLSSMVGIHAFQATRWTVAGQVPGPSGDHHPSICPYGLFRAADSALQIAVGSDGLWRRFAVAFDLDRPEWSTNGQRVAAREDVNAAVSAAFVDYQIEPLLQRLDELGIPSGRIRTIDQVYAWEQTIQQNLTVQVEHATLGPIVLPANPVSFGDAPHTGGRTHNTAPPTLGEHTEKVTAWLDL
jgi:crotonobetainyl-CoA:carnitine CoA-transferase CaiB-like acyl-CoA transferase